MRMTWLLGVSIGVLGGCEDVPIEEVTEAEPSYFVSGTPAIPEVDSLEIHAVTDNYYDMFQPQEKNATRHLLSKVPDLAGIAVRGEMGLGFIINATVGGVTHKILFDYGLTKATYRNNLSVLGLNVSGAEAMIVSHGHEDHWGAINEALDNVPTSVPVYVGHDDVYLQHLFVTPTNTADMGTLSPNRLSRDGRQVIVAPSPTLIAGVGLLSGFIPQTTAYETIPAALKVKRNGVLENATFVEEVALVFNVKNKGLVVITGCGHRGIINTTVHAQNITGVTPIAGVIGGMHMTTAPQATIDGTVADFQLLNPTFLMPMHCTGHRAAFAFQTSLPAPYVHPSVGTKYSF